MPSLAHTLADSIAEVHLRKATPALKPTTRALMARLARADNATSSRRVLADALRIARASGRRGA